MTAKQQVFAEQVLEVGPVKAARVAYPAIKDDRTAGIMAAQNMAKPTIIREISRAAEAQGLSRESCLDTIRECLKSENGAVALKAAELGLKLHGAFREAEAEAEAPMFTPEALTLFVKAHWAEKERRKAAGLPLYDHG